MLNPFVCGTFHHEKDYDEPCLGASPGSSPRKSKRKNSKNDNPYSTRGLDKFSALLADLDEKRQKIYSQMRPQDISFVRFSYSNTNDDVVPIVIKVKNKDHKQHKSQELKVRDLAPTSEPIDKSAITETTASLEERKQPKMESDKRVAKKSFSWNLKWEMLQRPSFYLPVVLILILVFLTVFGRSVATLCTCIVWYVVPTVKDYSSKPRKSMNKKDYARELSEKKDCAPEGNNKKKDYTRRWSEKNMATKRSLSPARNGDDYGVSKYKSTGKHSHKKSW